MNVGKHNSQVWVFDNSMECDVVSSLGHPTMSFPVLIPFQTMSHKVMETMTMFPEYQQFF